VVCFSFISSFPYFLSHIFKIQKLKGVWYIFFVSNLIIVILIDFFLFWFFLIDLFFYFIT
jgi:hypothetical protein